jgi:sigma-E factor negative regulatory protein RseB
VNLRRRRLGALAASALAIGSTLVARADESLEWLARMNQAVDGMNYVGTFVHLSGKESHASRVVHRAKGGALGERVVSLDGEEREVIRTASETRCILPAQRVVIVDRVRESSLRAALPECGSVTSRSSPTSTTANRPWPTVSSRSAAA